MDLELGSDPADPGAAHHVVEHDNQRLVIFIRELTPGNSSRVARSKLSRVSVYDIKVT